ncbi:hypothetical protein LZP69_14835 [Shewanella sp. AS1]|uniref:hypothetical protein n=1 Tax=Shewanella sp. AS1 TaxID=2907626 RepID=UPI001F3C3A4C|nr:hypothetical protein [Shewanella sp. AS1]MCE9680432.1 hypothetical protein [Shewanella sp. AS1]
MSAAPTFLFIPVSTQKGIGEYIRSTIIAHEIKRCWPDARIEFVLNRHVPYADSCEFPVHFVETSPTKHVKEVNRLVSQVKPDVVIFDASGRKAQMEHARRLGAKVVFISQHKRKRARGMRIGRALVTDSHWVVQPKFAIGDISLWEKLKLKLFNCKLPIFTGALFPRPDKAIQQALFDKFQIQAQEYLIYSAGSGGHRDGDELVVDRFAKAAQEHSAKSGIVSVMVFGPNYPKPLPKLEGVIAIKQLSSFEFINLLAGAKAAILAGGGTLLQAIALQVPILAVPVSKDQPRRIKHCVARGLALTCEADASAMLAEIDGLLQPQVSAQLRDNMVKEQAQHGLDICMAEITRLLSERAAKG